MSIFVISTIKQKNAAIFPLIEDVDLYGGMRVVADHTERANIPATYRKLGMLCWTQNDSKLWWLSSLPDTWTEFAGGGGGAVDVLVDSSLLAVENIVVGDPIAINQIGTPGWVLADAHESSPVRQEVHAMAMNNAAIGDPVDAALAGLVPFASGYATGTILYLGAGTGTGGGLTDTPPSGPFPGRRVTRLGQVHDAATVLMRIQLIGEL